MLKCIIFFVTNKNSNDVKGRLIGKLTNSDYVSLVLLSLESLTSQTELKHWQGMCQVKK